MKNYTKKPVTIQAVQWNGFNIKEMAKFMQTEEDGNWVQDLDLESMPHHTTLQGTHWIFDDSVLMIKTLEGLMMASKGDYIIRGVKGEYYPCKPDIFEMTYNEGIQEKSNEPRFVVKAKESLIKEETLFFEEEILGNREILGSPSNPSNLNKNIAILNADNVKGCSPIVCFAIQSDPISDVGVNGVQAVDMIRYCAHLIGALNDKFPCKENEMTITCLAEAIHWQRERTKNRQQRGVEGKNQA